MVNIMINFIFQEMKDVKNDAFQSVVTFEMITVIHGSCNSEHTECYESLPSSAFRILQNPDSKVVLLIKRKEILFQQHLTAEHVTLGKNLMKQQFLLVLTINGYTFLDGK